MTLLATKGQLESGKDDADPLSLEQEISFPLGDMHKGARLAISALVHP